MTYTRSMHSEKQNKTIKRVLLKKTNAILKSRQEVAFPVVGQNSLEFSVL